MGRTKENVPSTSTKAAAHSFSAGVSLTKVVVAPERENNAGVVPERVVPEPPKPSLADKIAGLVDQVVPPKPVDEAEVEAEQGSQVDTAAPAKRGGKGKARGKP